MQTSRYDLTRGELRASLIDRVRPVCPDLSDDEFEALIERMVEVELRWRDPMRLTRDPAPLLGTD